MNSSTIYADGLASFTLDRGVVKMDFFAYQSDINTNVKNRVEQVNKHIIHTGSLIFHIEEFLVVFSTIESCLDDITEEDVMKYSFKGN